MAAKPHGDTPPKVVINLDTLERNQSFTPFVVVVDGQRLTMADAQEVEWKTLSKAEQNPSRFIREVLPPDEAEAFFAAEIPAWKIAALMRAYREHFGLVEDQGE
jgi:hypothetical protein